MENLRKKFVLGINKKEKEIIIGEFEITSRNGYKEFTANFDIGKAFDIEEINLDEKCEDNWDCLDSETKIKLLEDGEITKQDVFDNWTCYSDYYDFVDCSCTNLEITLENNQTINFETTCGGQHDIRENEEYYKNIVFTNDTAVKLLLNLWDNYHFLKNVEDVKSVENDINYIINNLKNFTLYSENTKEFIKNNIDEV